LTHDRYDSKLTFSDLRFPQLSEDGKNIRRVKPIPGTYDPTPTSIYAVWPFASLIEHVDSARRDSQMQ
jgi:hypothetical protein